MTRLLLIEDDEHLASALSAVLTPRGHEVDVAATGAEGLRLLSREPEVVLIDLGLPDVSGLDVITRLRTTSQTPVVVLSGSREPDVVVRALDAGADDFVHKPFRLADLEARIRAVLRRPDLQEPLQDLRIGDLHLDLPGRRIELAGAPVRLTPTEWKVLVALIEGRGRVVGYEALGRAVWGGSDFIQARESLRVHVGALRAKLGGGRPDAPHLIVTESGVGYRFDAAAGAGGSAGSDGALADPAGEVIHGGDGRSARQLRHDLNNAVATLAVIAGMLDPAFDLGPAARAEAGARLTGAVEALRSVALEVGSRLSDER